MERPAGGFEAFEGFEGGQTAVLNALKNRWLERVAARVALERPAEGFKGKGLKRLTAGKQSFNALKNSWLGRVAARVALARPAEGFEALAGACSCESCLGKACGKVWSWELPRRVCFF